MTEKNRIIWPGWETVRLIGRGSFGAVYEIQRNIFDDIEKAALKVISIPQNVSDIDEMYSDGYDEESITSTFKSHLKSIVAEYSMMRKMNGCTNIVNCDDVRYVQHDDGIGWDIFIKMELLTPIAKALPTEVSEETVINIAKDICKALELCKKHEIVHRDIKPQNIFVSPNGDYKLGDFGIAKTVEKTMGGTKIGTYKYMAPEVYNNKPYGSAADIYSLGLVLYWLLNERRMPFLPLPPAKLSAGMDEAARTRRLSGEQFAEPKNGSEELKAIVMKACAYNVADRYTSASEMLSDLNQIGQMHSGLEKESVPAQAPKATSFKPVAPADEEDMTVGVFRNAVSDNAVIPDAQMEEETVGLFFKPAIGSDPSESTEVDVDALTEQNDATIIEAESELTEILAGEEEPTVKEDPVLTTEPRETAAENEPADSSAPKQSRKKLPIIIGAVAAVLIAVMAILLPGMGKETPDGTLLIDGSWENGSVTVIALDSSTLWIQIVDDRPDQQYKNLGTSWEVSLYYGKTIELENAFGDKIPIHPYYIRLESSATYELLTFEREKGTLFAKKNLWFARTHVSDNGWSYDKMLDVDVKIERTGNTYTAEVILPEWFDVSIVYDLAEVSVGLYPTTYWYDLYEKGSAQADGYYDFKP